MPVYVPDGGAVLRPRIALLVMLPPARPRPQGQ
jgi:hypothetical protein